MARDYLKYELALWVFLCGVGATVLFTSGEVIFGLVAVTVGALSAVALAVLLLRR